MAVPMLSCIVFWSRAPLWRLFLLTVNLSHARQVTYEVWGIHVTDGDVCSDWGECNGCLCQDGSGNNSPSIDDICYEKKCLSSNISAQNAENHMYRKGTWSTTGSNTTNWMMAFVSLVHNVIRNWPCLKIFFLIWTVWILKIKPFKCETWKGLFAHKRSLEPGRHSCTVNAEVHVCGYCGKVFKSRGSLQDHAWSNHDDLLEVQYLHLM